VLKPSSIHLVQLKHVQMQREGEGDTAVCSLDRMHPDVECINVLPTILSSTQNYSALQRREIHSAAHDSE
jgi:hypothetical protein